MMWLIDQAAKIRNLKLVGLAIKERSTEKLEEVLSSGGTNTFNKVVVLLYEKMFNVMHF